VRLSTATCRRANGSRRRVAEARDQLTAQELQIAQLAAEGLSNREIGQRLYLSHFDARAIADRDLPSRMTTSTSSEADKRKGGHP
jgi:FixJ family two-component response regulator